MELLSLKPLAWLLSLVALALAARYSLVDRPRLLKWLSFGCRALGILLLVIVLCRPYWLSYSQDVHVLYLVDASHSVELSDVSQALDDVETSIAQLGAGDGWTLFFVGATARPVETVARGRELLAQWQTGIGDDAFRGQSQLAAALLDTRLALPAGKAKRVVLISDGQETGGALDDALRQLAAEHVQVLRRPLAQLKATEAMVASLHPSARSAFAGEVVRLRANVAANQPVVGTLRLIHNGVAVQQKPVELSPGAPSAVDFDVEMTTPGASRWSVELVPAADHFPINNQAACTVQVRGKPRVLILHDDPREMRTISRALVEQEMEVEVRGKLGLPEQLEELLAFDAVVLADLPATAMTPAQMDMLKHYVVDYGGGLAMLGSENSFGLGGYFKTPVEEVLPLISRFEKEKEKPSLAMVLVIDKSGSMDGLPMELARQAAKAAAELLSGRDLIGVIGFDGAPQIVCELRSAGDVEAVRAAIDSLQAGGGTYLYPAMVEARSMLDTAAAKIRHMIILTDGHTQAADHQSLAQEAVDAGITVSTVALGAADKELLASIAEIGRGRYYETDDPANVPQIFTKETMQASKSAIKEDIFHPVQTGDHPLLSGFQETDLPFVLGYVMTEAKPTSQLLMATETGDPLLAVGRYGLGTGLAFTSDLTERWGGEWLGWESCGKFWAQALRGILRKADAAGVQVQEDLADDTWTITIDRRADDGTPMNAVTWDALATNEFGGQTPIDVEEIGVGRYRARVPLHNASRLTVRLLDRDYAKLKVLDWQRPYPREYALARQMTPELERLAEFPATEVRSQIVAEPQRHSLATLCYFSALGLFLASVLLRRI